MILIHFITLLYRRRFNRREAMPLAQAGARGEIGGEEEVVEDAQINVM